MATRKSNSPTRSIRKSSKNFQTLKRTQPPLNQASSLQTKSNKSSAKSNSLDSRGILIPSARQPATKLPPDIFKIPFIFDYIGNLFETSRSGDAVCRSEDLLALRIEKRNLKIIPGSPPRLVKASSSTAYLILHFPPQSIVEQSFFKKNIHHSKEPDNPHSEIIIESELPKPPTPNNDDPLSDLPVRARIAGESRLVFKIPNGFDIPYTLAGVLEACMNLAMRVTSNAKPPAKPSLLKLEKLFEATQLSKLSNTQKVDLAKFTLRSLQFLQKPNGLDTIRLRNQAMGQQLKTVPEQRYKKIPDYSAYRYPPKPKPPTSTQTSIELPWRLIISPHNKERWQHAFSPVTSEQTGHTELWHSRLTAPDTNGETILPSYSDPQRTIRAIWALSGEDSAIPMQSKWPSAPGELPASTNLPFRMPLTDFDRFQISHLSSNFSLPKYKPEPINTDLMMLSALGGWLDSRGGWEPPGLSVEEWVHRASMARDQFVRVVYRGCLVPFGHRVSLVKVTERMFHNGQGIEQASGNTAYLRQRIFIVVRERERRFDEFINTHLMDKDGVKLLNQFPFVKVRLLTQNTPDLDQPDKDESEIKIGGQSDQTLFWPHVNNQPFMFQCMAEDLDGNTVAFELPMMFMDNTKMGPITLSPPNLALQPKWDAAEGFALIAASEYSSKTYADNSSRKFNNVSFKNQKLALAGSSKPGDTAVEVDNITFGLVAEGENESLQNASNNLQRPVFFPKIESISARIGALSHLTGSTKNNTLQYNSHFLKQGFNNNKGQVFVDVIEDSDMAVLDFSAQGDRSGGFIQPNIQPKALSRIAGPVMSDVDQFIQGSNVSSGFPLPNTPSISDLPLPLLFGCIPLGELIEAVANLDDNPEKIPKFVTEASTAIESFVGGLGQLYNLVDQLAGQSGGIGSAALIVFNSTLDGLYQQSFSLSAAQQNIIQPPLQNLKTTTVALEQFLSTLSDTTSQSNGFIDLIGSFNNRIEDVVTAANMQVNAVSLPAGLQQSILSITQQMTVFSADLPTLIILIEKSINLFDALDDIVGNPGNIATIFSDSSILEPLIDAIQLAIPDFKSSLKASKLFEGAPRSIIIDALTIVEEASNITEDILDLLTGDELTIRFDWNPEISSWGLVNGSSSQPSDQLFRANNKKGLLVAVEAKVKKNGDSNPKINVACSLKHFDLVLIAPASFLELNFEKIHFSVNSAAKMDVDVVLTDIKFVGPLSFVETLRDLIPLDGFSDPPYLDISPQGIDAGFDVALPGISVGILNIHNLSLGAGFTVPFIGQPLSVRFNFCSREQPFSLTVYVFGGGGFFGVTIDPHGVQILEASFEFGASVSIDLGVASGGVYIMAGLYYRMEMDVSTLTGYFRLGGHVDVLGLITASLELYLSIEFEPESGKCTGRAQLTIEIEVFIFSGSVTVSCERKFAGSNGDPTLRHMLGFAPHLSLQDELALIQDDTEYAWREYSEAFA